MALNPAQDSSSYPVLYPSEIITLTCPHCFACIQFANGTSIQRNPGKMFLTNARVVFIFAEHSSQSLNFALHLNLITEETLTLVGHLTVFTGSISPYSTFLPSSGKFKIELDGEGEVFRKQVNNFIRQIRMASHNPIVNGNIPSNQAYVDPADPDMILIFEEKAELSPNA